MGSEGSECTSLPAHTLNSPTGLLHRHGLRDTASPPTPLRPGLSPTLPRPPDLFPYPPPHSLFSPTPPRPPRPILAPPPPTSVSASGLTTSSAREMTPRCMSGVTKRKRNRASPIPEMRVRCDETETKLRLTYLRDARPV
eukprot:scaffold4766_cov115-Isochrysis_galbana.AAC.14